MGKQELFRVDVQGSDICFDVKKGETVLRAAARQKISFPSLCNVGECGSCRCTLQTGQVQLKSDVSRHISDAQLAEGDILACQSTLKSSIELHVPTLSPHRKDDLDEAEKFSGTISGVSRISEDIIALSIDLSEPLHYHAGQFALLFVPGHARLSVEPRSYSLLHDCGDNGSTVLEFHVRHVVGGAFTDWLFEQDRTGDSVVIEAPFGSMALDTTAQSLLLIATGSGYAPINALLEAASEKKSTCATVVYGARTSADIYCKTLVEELTGRFAGTLDFIPVLSQEPTNSLWQGCRGYVQDHVGTVLNDLADHTVYLCGAPQMIDACIEVVGRQVNNSRIHYDKFLNRSHMDAGQSEL